MTKKVYFNKAVISYISSFNNTFYGAHLQKVLHKKNRNPFWSDLNQEDLTRLKEIIYKVRQAVKYPIPGSIVDDFWRELLNSFYNRLCNISHNNRQDYNDINLVVFLGDIDVKDDVNTLDLISSKTQELIKELDELSRSVLDNKFERWYRLCREIFKRLTSQDYELWRYVPFEEYFENKVESYKKLWYIDVDWKAIEYDTFSSLTSLNHVL